MTNLRTMIEGLTNEIERFDSGLPIETATPPPSSWYVDSAFLELEKETVFSRNWQFVGRLDQVAEPGAFFCGSLLRWPYVVTRDAEGVLRAFYNVCAHHGTKVASGSGCVEHFTCPYHGWEYHLSGGLRRAPLAGAVDAIKTGNVGLQPIQVATWGPFVLLHFGTPTQNVAEFFAQLDQELDWLSMESPNFVARRVYELDCNWKVYVDNYLDGGYHVPHMHPDLCSKLEFSEYKSRLGDIYSVQSCPASGDSRIGELSQFLWVYPNFMANRYGRWLDTNLVLPVDERRCKVVFDYFYDGEIENEKLELELAESDRVQQEDTEIVGLVQEGLESGVYRGLYASKFESPMYQFHGLLAAEFKLV